MSRRCYTKKEKQELRELLQIDGRDIAEEVGGFYRLEGDGHWQEMVYGPGGSVSILALGPGPNFDPRPIGPCRGEEISDIAGKPDPEEAEAIRNAIDGVAKKKK